MSLLAMLQLAALAELPGSGVAAAEDEIEATRAIEGLGQLIAVGYRNANEIRTESSFDSLRNRPDFRVLMMDVEFPIEPFAGVVR